MRKAVFLDRDGVINRKPPEGSYVTRWEDMEFLPGVTEAVRLLNRGDFRVIVVTNQRCVAKGLISAPEVEALHRRMCEVLAASGAVIDEVCYCPHEIEPPCACRKPKPGLLLEAARAHQIDLAASWMIGDSDCDVQAGRNAGCKTAQILADHQIACSNADLVAPSLFDAIQRIILRDGRVGARDADIPVADRRGRA